MLCFALEELLKMRKGYKTPRLLKQYIFSYLCILLFPLILLAGFVYNYVLDVLNEEVQSNNLASLRNARDTVEAQVEYILSLENVVYLESSLNPFSLEADTMRAIEIQQELYGYLRSNPFLYDMAYYQENDRYIITALSSCPKEMFFGSMYSFENWKYEDLLEGLKRGQGVFLEGVQEVVTNTGERRMLVPLVQALGAAPYNRCIIYLIDASFFTNILPNPESGNGVSAIVSRDGQTIAYSGNDDLIAEVSMDTFAETGTQRYVKLESDRYLISYLYSENTQWIYFTLVPGSSIVNKAEHVRFLMTLMAFLVLISGGVGAYFLARRNYTPIRSLEAFTNTILENKENANEIDHVANVLSYLDQQNKRLAADDEVKTSAMRERFVLRFLSGQYGEEDEIVRNDSCGLSECFEPYVKHVLRMVEKGRDTAREVYGCRGSVGHHNTDCFGNTDLEGLPASAYMWPMGLLWLSLELYDHYLYTQDQKFLAGTVMPVLKESVLFFYDYMYRDGSGEWLTGPSVSPENTYETEDGQTASITMAPAMDNELLWELCQDYLSGWDVLGEDREYEETVFMAKEILEHLPPIRLTEDGRIREWREDYKETEKGHRHLSHLYALYPGYQISHDTPELLEAARRSLKVRLENADGHIGWSRAWLVCMYARLWDKNGVGEGMEKYLSGSVLDNLYNSHPPFQIDGNFGICAGIVEAIVQCRDGKIFLLPAVPDEWEDGSVKGMKLRGGITLDMKWTGTKVSFRLLSQKEQKVEVICGGEHRKLSLTEGKALEGYFQVERGA